MDVKQLLAPCPKLQLEEIIKASFLLQYEILPWKLGDNRINRKEQEGKVRLTGLKPHFKLNDMARWGVFPAAKHKHSYLFNKMKAGGKKASQKLSRVAD